GTANLPGFAFFGVLILVVVLVVFIVLVVLKVFIIKDFVVVRIVKAVEGHDYLKLFSRRRLYGAGGRGWRGGGRNGRRSRLRGRRCWRCRGGCGGCRGGAWLGRIRRPVMTATLLADPELIRLPRSTRGRISQVHLFATTLAPNRDTDCAHARILTERRHKMRSA